MKYRLITEMPYKEKELSLVVVLALYLDPPLTGLKRRKLKHCDGV